MRIVVSLILLLANVTVSADSELLFEVTGQQNMQKFSLNDDALRLSLPGDNYYLYQHTTDQLFLVMPSVKNYQLVPKKGVIEQSREQINTLRNNYDKTMADPNVSRSIGSADSDVAKLADFAKLENDLDELEKKQQMMQTDMNDSVPVVAKKPRRVGGVRCIEQTIDQPTTMIKLCLADAKSLKFKPKMFDTYNAYDRYMKTITGVATPNIEPGQFVVSNEIYNKKKRANGTFKVDKRPASFLIMKSNKRVEYPVEYFLVPEDFKLLNAQ